MKIISVFWISFIFQFINKTKCRLGIWILPAHEFPAMFLFLRTTIVNFAATTFLFFITNLASEMFSLYTILKNMIVLFIFPWKRKSSHVRLKWLTHCLRGNFYAPHKFSLVRKLPLGVLNTCEILKSQINQARLTASFRNI